MRLAGRNAPRKTLLPLHSDGTLNFYGSTDPGWANGEWVEYDAIFSDGQLVSIERIPDTSTQITLLASPDAEASR